MRLADIRQNAAIQECFVTVSLFAALHARTGRVIGRCHQRRRGVEFRKFLRW